MIDPTTPWGQEGLTRSKWLLRHRGAINMTIQALADPAVDGMAREEIVAHVTARSVPAPAAAFAAALIQSAEHHERVGGHADAARLREAAAVAGSPPQG